MGDTKPSSRIHPLVAGAAVSVMLASLTGVAAMTGFLPNSHSSAAPGAASAAQPAAQVMQGQTVPATPATALIDNAPSKSVPNRADDDKPAVKQRSSTPASTTTSPYARSAQPAVTQVAKICDNCGRIESINTIQHEAKPSGVGIAAGAVLGGVLGNQIGDGNGRKVATVAGAVGGGFAGNEIEKRARATMSYEVRVRMEDGQVRTFPYTQQPSWNIGDRVRVVNGQLASRA